MFRLLNKDEIDVRIAQIDKNWCTLLLYKDARVDQNLLDETFGKEPGNGHFDIVFVAVF